MPTQKRFIAGAVCPNCKVADKTVMYASGENSIRECVSCGHRESLDQLGQQNELPTRVAKTELGEQADTTQAQPVQIVDPRTLH